MGLTVPINTFDKVLAHNYRKTSTKWSSVTGEGFDVILDTIYFEIIFGPVFIQQPLSKLTISDSKFLNPSNAVSTVFCLTKS